MLTQLRIKTFRGISGATLADLSRFNVIIGCNGSGKTSILEAVALASNPLNPGWLSTFGKWRELPGVNAENTDALVSAFPTLDIQKPIELEYEVADKPEVYTLRMSAITGGIVFQGDSDPSSDSTSSSAPDSNPQLTGIISELLADGKGLHKAELTLVPQGFQTAVKGVKKNNFLGAFFIHARRATSLGETSRALTELYSRKQQNEFIRAMRSIEPRLENLIPGTRQNSPTVLADVGLPTLMPINLLGDGFCRISLMVTGAVLGTSKLLVIDEIDSGLHHTVMADFWRSLMDLTSLYGVQVFCTTHNEEMLRSTLEAFADQPEAIRIYRMDRSSDGKTGVQPYSYDLFNNADSAGLDVR